MKKKRTGLPRGFDPATGETPTPPKKLRKPQRDTRIRIRQPLARRPSPEKVKRFTDAGKKFQWRPGVSGNPSGRSKKLKGALSYQEFTALARSLSPRAIERLREALELDWSKESARTILTAAALVMERGFGRAVAINVDIPPDREAPTIPLDQEYWNAMTSALRESGALVKPIDAAPREDVVDAEVVAAEEVKQLEGPPK